MGLDRWRNDLWSAPVELVGEGTSGHEVRRRLRAASKLEVMGRATVENICVLGREKLKGGALSKTTLKIVENLRPFPVVAALLGKIAALKPLQITITTPKLNRKITDESVQSSQQSPNNSGSNQFTLKKEPFPLQTISKRLKHDRCVSL
jgi:hypothetical protein